MTLVRRVALPLRVLLVLAFLALLVLQTLSFPGQFRHDAQEHPGHDLERWALTALAALVIACFEVIIVCTWALLARVLTEEIFTRSSLRWVDTIIGAMAAGWLLIAVPFAVAVRNADDPGEPLLISVLLLAGAVVGLLMLVLRALLQQATMLRTDLEGVI